MHFIFIVTVINCGWINQIKKHIDHVSSSRQFFACMHVCRFNQSPVSSVVFFFLDEKGCLRMREHSVGIPVEIPGS